MLERLKERDRALRGGWIGEMPPCDSHPPCSRHDDAADDSAERVRMTLAYAMGLAGGSCAADLVRHVARLHDHKGLLAVCVRGPLPERCRRALRVAWGEVAGEQPDQVEFAMDTSPRWQALWSARRFESNWKA